jgi:hypothetical protein
MKMKMSGSVGNSAARACCGGAAGMKSFVHASHKVPSFTDKGARHPYVGGTYPSVGGGLTTKHQVLAGGPKG